MAGSCRPDVSLLESNKEAKIKILDWKGMYGSSTGNGLVDGSISGLYAEPSVCYWHASGAYVKFEIYTSINLWGFASDGIFMNFPNMLLLDSNGTNVMKTYYANESLSTGKWCLLLKELPPGTYTLQRTSSNNSLTIISELYGEDLCSGYIIKQNERYYIANEAHYNTETQMYNEVDESMLSYSNFINIRCNDLFERPNYLGGERPIDKFSGQIQIIKNNDLSVKVNALKSTEELIVANDDFNNGLAKTINSITANNEVSNGGEIKMAVSFDSGLTWKTYMNNRFEDLSITIPLKKYSELSSEELSQWNSAKDEILQRGFNIDDISSMNFNVETDQDTQQSVSPYKIRFAYTIKKENALSSASTASLNWDFNANGHMELLTQGSDYKVYSSKRSVVFKSLIENELIKINAIF